MNVYLLVDDEKRALHLELRQLEIYLHGQTPKLEFLFTKDKIESSLNYYIIRIQIVNICILFKIHVIHICQNQFFDIFIKILFWASRKSVGDSEAEIILFLIFTWSKYWKSSRYKFNSKSHFFHNWYIKFLKFSIISLF